MSVRDHLEAAWKASLLEPHNDEYAHILWSIGRRLGPETMARLTHEAMCVSDPELVAERLETLAGGVTP